MLSVRCSNRLNAISGAWFSFLGGWRLFTDDRQVKPVHWAAIQNNKLFHDSHVKDMHPKEDAHVRFNSLFSPTRFPWTFELFLRDVLRSVRKIAESEF